MTKQVATTAAPDTRINWRVSLAKLDVGDKLLVHGRTQAQVGSCLATHNRGDKRFVSQKTKGSVYVIRIN